jgi:hypothetical protein
MIAFRDNLPLVQLQTGRTVAFERDWLVRSLIRAARKAGFSQWWLAEHVAESVTEYLRSQTELNVLSVDHLTKAVQSVLQVIGYAEVGSRFEAGRPVAQISLVDLARAAGTGYELAFFDMLGRRIQGLVNEEHCDFELFGLEPCVKLLRARKAWSRDCDALRAEIVSFAREQTGIAAAAHEVSFSLA